MALHELIVVDVGHGNSAIITNGNNAIVIDCGHDATLLEVLLDRKITTIDALFVSHADADHVGGAGTLLTSQYFQVLNLYVNPDASKDSEVWRNFRLSVSNAVKGNVQVHTGIHSGNKPLTFGPWQVTVLGPTAGDVLGGVSGKSLSGNRSTSNSLSVVLQVDADGKPGIVFTADINGAALAELSKELNPRAVPLVVFPHHGGRPTRPDEFVDQLVALFSPTYFLVSSARGRDHHPHIDVLEKLRSLPGIGVACTQLSEHCSAQVASDDTHLLPLPARGRAVKSCCAGTMSFGIPAFTNDIRLEFAKHRKFVSTLVPSRQCQ